MKREAFINVFYFAPILKVKNTNHNTASIIKLAHYVVTGINGHIIREK